ncbi:GDNF-inducible zinc finger protein 1 [Microdochium nivale]|nr:GDNF-inducible zinc finger protein 1 [Microdochium nivale]
MPGNNYFECGTCYKEFPAGSRARDSHCYATGHEFPDHECDTCHATFYSQTACEQHMRAKRHMRLECDFCYETYLNEQDRSRHEAQEHDYCRPCDRHFQSQNNIQMHLNSRIHRGANIDCPFCDRAYATATGLAHHIETGSCSNAPNLNRDQIYRMIRSRDTSGVMTKNLLDWHGSNEYEATSQSWNGYGYECYLCHRSFNSLHGLNQHLNSPVHQQALYHCPKQDCRKDFKSLAGLLNHLESETCGYMRFSSVQTQVQGMISRGRLLTSR